MDRTRIVAELRAEIQRLQAAVSALDGGRATAKSGRRGGKRHLSADARERIAAAQRKRWAKQKRAKATT